VIFRLRTIAAEVRSPPSKQTARTGGLYYPASGIAKNP
jgi:hypothetical protein